VKAPESPMDYQTPVQRVAVGMGNKFGSGETGRRCFHLAGMRVTTISQEETGCGQADCSIMQGTCKLHGPASHYALAFLLDAALPSAGGNSPNSKVLCLRSLRTSRCCWAYTSFQTASRLFRLTQTRISRCLAKAAAARAASLVLSRPPQLRRVPAPALSHSSTSPRLYVQQRCHPLVDGRLTVRCMLRVCNRSLLTL